MRYEQALTRSGKIDGRSRAARMANGRSRSSTLEEQVNANYHKEQSENFQQGRMGVQKAARAARASAPAENPTPVRGKKPGKPQDDRIVIPPLKIVKTVVHIKALSPYIAHQFSEKAKEMMRAKHQKRARSEREIRQPKVEYEAAKYKDANGDDAIPSLAFKCAIVDAASFIQGVTKVQIRGAVFIEGEFVKLQYTDELMREDVVRVGMGSADLRYRPEYRQWYAALPIQFDSDIISAEQLYNLVQRAGFAIGVGEWRPQKNGQYGRFEVDPNNGAGTTKRNGRRNGIHRVK